MWGAGFRDGTRTRINVNSDTQSVSRALLSERDKHDTESAILSTGRTPRCCHSCGPGSTDGLAK